MMGVNSSKFEDKVSEEILMTEIEENLKVDKKGMKLREYIDRIGMSKSSVKKQLAKGCSPDMKNILEKLNTAWEQADFIIRKMHERLSIL